MPQKEGEANYKYEDYASEEESNRLSSTSALVKQKMKITLDSGSSFDLEFVGSDEVIWKSGDDTGTDWCDVAEVAPQTYFIDMTFTHEPLQSQTFVVNTETRQVLAVRTIMREGDVGREPRAVHIFTPGILGDPSVPLTGRKPGPTRDLIGLRGLYSSPGQCFEHIYLNSKRYAWQCIKGPLRGESDVDMAATYKFDDNQYIFAFREFGIPVSAVFFYNWDQMRSTGKFFVIGDDGKIKNTPVGTLIMKLSMAFYPLNMQPI